MRPSPFYRNHCQSTQELPRKTKNARLSIDNLVASPTRQINDLCKLKRTIINSSNTEKRKNDHLNCSKTKQPFCNTTKNSVNATRNNSPFKGCKPNSQTLLPPPLNIKNFKFYYQIGFGAFGRVWKVQQKESGRQYALKEISKSKVLEKCNIGSVLNERVILSGLTHPFLVNMHAAFQDQCNLYLTMDYLRGADLRYHICYKEHFCQKQIRFIAACLVLALENVHANNVIHRDVKPQNILFEENGYVRLTDFGIARHRMSQQNLSKNQASGTPVYMAPEILFRRDFSFESDYYALGVVLFQLALGKRPYLGKSRTEVRQELLNREICLSEFQLPTKISPQLINLINRLLKKNPIERLGRGGARQLKEHPFFKGLKWAKLATKETKPPFIPNVVCQTQGYLNEISLFNEMNQDGKENSSIISPELDRHFIDYQFFREDGKEGKCRNRAQLKKNRRGSQGKINF